MPACQWAHRDQRRTRGKGLGFGPTPNLQQASQQWQQQQQKQPNMPRGHAPSPPSIEIGRRREHKLPTPQKQASNAPKTRSRLSGGSKQHTGASSTEPERVQPLDQGRPRGLATCSGAVSTARVRRRWRWRWRWWWGWVEFSGVSWLVVSKIVETGFRTQF